MSSHKCVKVGLLRGVLPHALILMLVTLAGCSSLIPNRNPIGERFPEVVGTSLEGETTRLPDALGGALSVVMVGYTQRSQFDIDRWILGLTQLQTPARVIEVPTIPGLFPGLFASRIDEGMRGGIPEEDWPAVITVYDGAERITEFLGTDGKNNARILLLDSRGHVLWLSDRGYSATLVTELDRLVRSRTSPKTSPSK